MDPEKAHSLGIQAMKMGLHPAHEISDPRLNVNLFGKTFSNPVGLSAGFDKNAEVIAPVLKMGFGFIETGGVTIEPQAGLPKPRIFRDPVNECIINKMNFPNVGMKKFKNNIEKFRTSHPSPKGIVGIQIAMSSGQTEPEKDFKVLIKYLGPLADYIVFNVSCPNTPGLRNLQAPENLKPLLIEIKQERDKLKEKPPVLVKLSPDITPQEQEDIAHVLKTEGIDGVILTNTTTTRPGILPQDFANRQGGLSGTVLTEKSNEVTRNFYKLTKGQIPIIGVGGISTAEEAYERIKSGASLIQLYTAMVYKGPDIAKDINEGLLKLLEKDGLKSIKDAVGKGH
jgi:dihydroorotate dehydrogenase